MRHSGAGPLDGLVNDGLSVIGDMRPIAGASRLIALPEGLPIVLWIAEPGLVAALDIDIQEGRGEGVLGESLLTGEWREPDVDEQFNTVSDELVQQFL